jgi:hypothetical protein
MQDIAAKDVRALSDHELEQQIVIRRRRIEMHRYNPSEAGAVSQTEEVALYHRLLEERERRQCSMPPSTAASSAYQPPVTKAAQKTPALYANNGGELDDDVEGVPIIVTGHGGVPRSWRKGDPIHGK